MIICPKCGGVTEYNLYFSAYQCLQNDCRYYKSKYDLTDEDKIYFNRQEGNDRWELDEPVDNISLIEGDNLDVKVERKDGRVQYLMLEEILKVICRVAYKEIRALK